MVQSKGSQHLQGLAEGGGAAGLASAVGACLPVLVLAIRGDRERVGCRRAACMFVCKPGLREHSAMQASVSKLLTALHIPDSMKALTLNLTSSR